LSPQQSLLQSFIKFIMYILSILLEKKLLEKSLKSIESFTSNSEKNSRFCIGCGEPATKLVKYSTEGAIIIEKYCDKCAKAIEDSSQINAN
jgi:hypothetical protein